MKKIAIVGASYLQRPLVEKAAEMGLETHVFAWEQGNVVHDIANYFYPISILDKEAILEECAKIGIDGITSIGSDIAMPTVNYVATQLGLIGNSLESTRISTDKFEMRKALQEAGISCPTFYLFETASFTEDFPLEFPAIVKPTDRSGSRGVTKVLHVAEVNAAIDKALAESIEGRVIVEEFMEGREFSVEMISCNQEHHFLTITDKVTTGAPYFVETEHHQPADISEETAQKIEYEVKRALSALNISNGASHSEVFLTPQGEIRIVEIAGRMGGELIGSDMVALSTGYDFVRGTIEVALGIFNKSTVQTKKRAFSGVFYVLPEPGEIVGVQNNVASFEEVLKAISILQTGEIVDTILDGAGKRAGIVVYESKKGRVSLNPTEVLSFETKATQTVEFV